MEYTGEHTFNTSIKPEVEACRTANNLETLLPNFISGKVIDEETVMGGENVRAIGYSLIDGSFIKAGYAPAIKGRIFVETKGPNPEWVQKVLKLGGNISVIADQRHKPKK